MVRKIRVILNIKHLRFKSKIKNQKFGMYSKINISKFQFGKLLSKIRFLILILILIFDFDFDFSLKLLVQFNLNPATEQ